MIGPGPARTTPGGQQPPSCGARDGCGFLVRNDLDGRDVTVGCRRCGRVNSRAVLELRCRSLVRLTPGLSLAVDAPRKGLADLVLGIASGGSPARRRSSAAAGRTYRYQATRSGTNARVVGDQVERGEAIVGRPSGSLIVDTVRRLVERQDPMCFVSSGLGART